MASSFGSWAKFHRDITWQHRNTILFKGQNWNNNGRYMGRIRFVQSLPAYIAGLDGQNLERYMHDSTDPVIFNLQLACKSCNTMICKYPRNVSHLLRTGNNSSSAVKHRLKKNSALLNGTLTRVYCPLNTSTTFALVFNHECSKAIFPRSNLKQDDREQSTKMFYENL